MAKRKKETLDVQDDGYSVGEALEAAGQCQAVLVIGVEPTGQVALFSSMQYAPDLLWAIELARLQIVEMANELSD